MYDSGRQQDLDLAGIFPASVDIQELLTSPDANRRSLLIARLNSRRFRAENGSGP